MIPSARAGGAVESGASPAATGVLAAFPLLWYLPLLSFLTPLIGSLDRGFAMQWILLAILPCLFWLLDWKLIRFDDPLDLVGAAR